MDGQEIIDDPGKNIWLCLMLVVCILKLQYHSNVYLLTWFFINLEKNGPTTDHDGMRIFYFMNVWAQDGQLDDEGAWLQSPLIEGKDHPFGCFHFWFTFKVY